MNIKDKNNAEEPFSKECVAKFNFLNICWPYYEKNLRIKKKKSKYGILWHCQKTQFDLGIKISFLIETQKWTWLDPFKEIFASFFNSMRINEKLMRSKTNVKQTDVFFSHGRNQRTAKFKKRFLCSKWVYSLFHGGLILTSQPRLL